MKKTNLLLPMRAVFIGLLLTLLSSVVMAQESEGSKKEVRVKIVQNINGNTSTIEKTFSAEDEEALRELLEDYDLDIDTDDILRDRHVEINIRRSGDGSGGEDVSVKIDGDDEGESKNMPRAFLGVFTEDVDNYDIIGSQPEKGAVVSHVIPETPAEKAGLKKGDIITKVNEREITDSEQFRETIRSFKPGDEVVITILRDGKEVTVTTALGEKKGPPPFPKFPREGYEWQGKIPPMHFHLHDELNDRPFLGIVPDDESDAEGVQIGEVIENSTAEEMGLKEGDIVIAINDKPVKNFEELREVIKNINPGEEVKVKYLREGQAAEASGRLKSKRESMWFRFGNPPPHDCWTYGFGHEWNKDKEITKEDLERKIERLEKEIQKLKEQLGQLNDSGSFNKSEKSSEETKMTITIEDISKNNLKAENLLFSPNPSSGKFHLSFELPEKGKTAVKIFDVTNKEIYSESLGKFSGRYERQIDVSENPKGIYFLQITQDGKILNKKIVVQ